MNPCRILVVDGDAAVAKDTVSRLAALGYEPVGLAASAEQALTLVEENCPDLALVATGLKGAVDGIAVAGEMRRRFDVPTVFLADCSDDETLKRAGLAGPCGCLFKPFGDGELKSAVEIAIHRRRAAEDLRRRTMFLETLLDAIPHPVFYKDARLRYLGCNKAFEQFIGVGREHLAGKTVYDVWPRDLADLYDRADREILAGREQQGYEGIIQASDGTRYDMMFRKAAFRDKDGSTGGIIGVMENITERKRTEKALRESEERVRLKLDCILSPEGDMGNLELADIIDVEAIQRLVEDFYELTHFPVCIVDLKGVVLASVGWRDICTKFHRAHPRTRQHCTESDLLLSQGISSGEFRLYKCRNNMWDVATPIVVGGQKQGNLFSGQFFFDDEALDYEVFRSQAREYGFNEAEYIAALDNVPRVSRDFVEKGMTFLVKLAHTLSLLSYSNIKLARSLEERSRLMESLREGKERLNLALAASRMGVWEWDVRTDAVFWSPECHEILGVDRFGGKLESFTEVVHPDDLARVMTTAGQALAERATYKQEYRIIRPGGGIRWVSNLGRAEYDEMGMPLRLVGTVQDITEQREAEGKRVRVEAQLHQAQKMEALGTLAGGIAHDFNNILGIIVGYTEMARWDAEEDSPTWSNLQEVLKASNRAKGLVQQILAFSRRTENEKKPMQIGPILKEAMKMLRASLPPVIEIRVNVAASAVVLADPAQILQMLMNLCTNAAHAMMEGGGVLDVSLTEVRLGPEAIRLHSDLQPGLHVKLTVRDTGPGIDSAIMGRIFDPFFTTKGPGAGTGLGLAVVHGIAKSHRGTVEVESPCGGRTSFTVFLPAMENASAQEIAEGAGALPLGRQRILVVDDEPALAEIVAQMLRHLGYEVERRMSSVEGLDAFRRQPIETPFELVITDMAMPHLTGVDLARELRRVQPDLPMILLSGFSEKIDLERAKSFGFQGFLMKPVVMKDLAELVRKVLDDR